MWVENYCFKRLVYCNVRNTRVKTIKRCLGISVYFSLELQPKASTTWLQSSKIIFEEKGKKFQIYSIQNGCVLHLEYDIQFWSPHFEKCVIELEKQSKSKKRYQSLPFTKLKKEI